MEIGYISQGKKNEYYIDCTEMVKASIGDSVKEAKLFVEVVSTITQKQALEALKKLSECIQETYNKSNIVWIDDNRLVVTLKNGACFEFRGSEYASLQKVENPN